MKFKDIPTAELKKAVALQYDGKQAPTVTAKGLHSQAEEIIALAEEAGVPLCDNAALVDLLTRLELGEEIPFELYTAIAYILAFAFEISHRDTRLDE